MNDRGIDSWRLRLVCMAACTLLVASASPVATAQTTSLFDGVDGASCDYFNMGARIRWRHRLGDWKDLDGTVQGSRPFAQAVVLATDANRIVTWDVTGLVHGWLAGEYANYGMAIVNLKAPGADGAVFHSRETPDASARPRLVLMLSNGATRRVAPSADATVDCSTFRSLGTLPTLTAGIGHSVVVQFDLAEFKGTQVSKATLELAATARQYGNTSLGIFRVDPPLPDPKPNERPGVGIAARYTRDRGIDKDPYVIMATGFDSAFWRGDWSYVSLRSVVERVDSAPKLGFQPLSDHALQVEIPAGENLGLDMGYKFADKLGHEPEEVYFRYYLRLANDWKPSPDGGKLPGISATYGHTGWGGRKADGSTGWSMRGSFSRVPDRNSPYHDLTPIGTYAYHADMEEDFGDTWDWSSDGRALLARNRWYCIEQYFKVNQPGRTDGILRAWVDGLPVYERTGIRVRDIPSIKIEQIWMNVYYGGPSPSPAELHLFIDNVVIARKYIGPITP